MKGLSLRMVLYTLAAMIAAFGFGDFNAETGDLALSLNMNQIAMALGAGGAVNAAIVGIWGKK